MEKETIKNLINVLGLVKDLKRTGWVMYGVDGAESDAEHSFGVAMLAMMLAPKEIDKLKCLELALVHDMAEIYTGDFTPFDNISKDEKYRLEAESAEKIAKEISWPKFRELIEEYNAKQTKEAKFISLLDKIETAMTAKYYDKNNRCSRKLSDEFYEYANRYADNTYDEELAEIKDLAKNLK